MKINANEQARLIPSLVVKQREAMSWERSAWNKMKQTQKAEEYQSQETPE
jgi:hypothetical protein